MLRSLALDHSRIGRLGDEGPDLVLRDRVLRDLLGCHEEAG